MKFETHGLPAFMACKPFIPSHHHIVPVVNVVPGGLIVTHYFTWLQKKLCMHTLPWFCPLVDAFKSVPAAPNMTVRRPRLGVCQLELIVFGLIWEIQTKWNECFPGNRHGCGFWPPKVVNEED
jgi:hypothetical protein